jgi:2-polyprenyl-3-methyl-5-hydroxy-6-metoxy-1,4-benzoquinol methylase
LTSETSQNQKKEKHKVSQAIYFSDFSVQTGSCELIKTNGKQVEEIVKDWFTKKAIYEWQRLQRNPYHQIEFIVTMHFLEKYLPKDGLVLDAGGGPGRYTIELAKRGYDVVLLDLVPEMLKVARRKIKKAGVLGRVKQFVQGSIEDLSMFTDETFDAVLCLGAPLCHVLNAKQREKAAAELVRVAKKRSTDFRLSNKAHWIIKNPAGRVSK